MKQGRNRGKKAILNKIVAHFYYACAIIKLTIRLSSSERRRYKPLQKHKHMVKYKHNKSGIEMKSEPILIQDIANWFLCKEPMTHKKLQKLCYYAVAWGYALNLGKIVEDDEFQAWVHGPVSPKLYAKYKGKGWSLISPDTCNNSALPKNVEELLESVWLTYGEKSGNELEALSHNEKPWKEARDGLADDERGEVVIPPKTMSAFYQTIFTGDL